MPKKITMRQKGHGTEWEWIYDGKAYVTKKEAEAAMKSASSPPAKKKTLSSPSIAGAISKAKGKEPKEDLRTEAKRIGLRDIKEKFPEGHKKMVEDAKAKAAASGKTKPPTKVPAKTPAKKPVTKPPTKPPGGPITMPPFTPGKTASLPKRKKGKGLSAKEFRKIKEFEFAPVYLTEKWEKLGYDLTDAREAWEKYKNK